MVMATVINPKSQGVRIALTKAHRAYELMQAFKRASVNQKVKWYVVFCRKERPMYFKAQSACVGKV